MFGVMDKQAERFVAEAAEARKRLDCCLRERFPSVSRNAVQRLIREGRIRVNGRLVKTAHRLSPGDEVNVEWPEQPKPWELRPEEIPLELLYEDDWLLALNKPAGLVTHPAPGHWEGTLAHALLHHCGERLSGIGGVARPGIVHRLDRDTSGVMVVAKNDAAHRALARQFAARRVRKIYWAIVCGEPAQDQGVIDAPVARHPRERKRMAVVGNGRPASTAYRVIERFGPAALAEAELHSGRTHQVRVHFKHLGHPLAGDPVYGERANRRLAAAIGFRPPRQMLHARLLGFAHPEDGRPMEFEAPPPADFMETLERLRRGKGSDGGR